MGDFGRDAQFSLTYGRVWYDGSISALYRAIDNQIPFVYRSSERPFGYSS